MSCLGPCLWVIQPLVACDRLCVHECLSASLNVFLPLNPPCMGKGHSNKKQTVPCSWILISKLPLGFEKGGSDHPFLASQLCRTREENLKVLGKLTQRLSWLEAFPAGTRKTPRSGARERGRISYCFCCVSLKAKALWNLLSCIFGYLTLKTKGLFIHTHSHTHIHTHKHNPPSLRASFPPPQVDSSDIWRQPLPEG